LLHEPFAAVAGVIGAAVCSGAFRRSRFALADAVEAAVPVAARESVLFEAGTSSMIVPFLLSYVMANMVPLLAMPLATGPEEPVERGVVEDEVVLVRGLPEAAGRVEFPVGLGLTVTVTRVVFEKWTVEVEWAAAALRVPLVLGAAVIEAVLRGAPVACATPAVVVLFVNSATVARA
jgi:hypothetical protein